MTKQKLTKEFRAELMSALLLAADRFKSGRTRSRGICSVLCGLRGRGRFSYETYAYLTSWISKSLGYDHSYLNSWLRWRVTDFVPTANQPCHGRDRAQVRKLRQTRINWIMWMYNELKEGR